MNKLTLAIIEFLEDLELSLRLDSEFTKRFKDIDKLKIQNFNLLDFER